MPFFNFSQNNSFGLLDFDADLGITSEVVIEADNSEQANEIMGELIDHNWLSGESGYCECCGDRWELQKAGNFGTAEPTVYSKTKEAYLEAHKNDKDSVCVHYASGVVDWW